MPSSHVGGTMSRRHASLFCAHTCFLAGQLICLGATAGIYSLVRLKKTHMVIKMAILCRGIYCDIHDIRVIIDV